MADDMQSVTRSRNLFANWRHAFDHHLPWARANMGRHGSAYECLDDADAEDSSSATSPDGRNSPGHDDRREKILNGATHPSSHNLLRNTKSWVTTLAGILICVSLAFISYATLTGILVSKAHSGILPSRISLGTCGKSPEEARARGCVFDLFIGSFMKKECFDQGLHDRFMREHDWTFYHDAEGTDEIPLEQVLAGEFEEIWMDGTFHYTHCAYVWEKHWRALEAGAGVVLMDSRTRNGHHIEHCIDFIGAPNATYVAGRTSSHIHQHFGLVDCVVGPM